MNKVQRKKRQKLTVKIIFSLLMVLMLGYLMIIGIYSLAYLLGFRIPEQRAELELWIRVLFYLMQPIFGVIIIIMFGYAINRIVVKRIYQLEHVTKKVAQGDYSVTLEAKGNDELSNLIRSFNWMSNELKANEYLNKEFIRNVSHEYKTPISIIRVYAELLLIEIDQMSISAEIKETFQSYITIMIEECDYLNQLTKSALELSLLDSTTIIKKEDCFEPSLQVEEILRKLYPQLDAKGLFLNLSIEKFEITSNRQLLYQVWLNLIHNAIKFSRLKRVITIKLSKVDHELVFSINDQGLGIKTEEQKNIFDQFFISNQSRNPEGSGLGLTIVKKIIDKLEGSITFESVENEGSTFEVRLKI